MGKILEVSIDGNVVADRVVLCDDWESKRTGLLGRNRLASGEGVLMPMPGIRSLSLGFLTSIHMVGMKFDIAVAWLKKDGTVVKSVKAKKGDLYHATFHPANYVMELHEDHLHLLKKGSMVTWKESANG